MDNYEGMNPVETSAGMNPEAKPVETCSKCGAELAEGQDFCPKCGTPRVKKNICGKCGAELQEGQEFCPKCGQKVGLSVDSGVSSAINQFNAGVDKANAKKKKTPIIIAVAVVIIALVAIAGVKLAPKIFVSVDDLCAQGNYEKAYSKANDDEKDQVYAENLVAVLSAQAADGLKDRSSFELRDAWFDKGNQAVVLQVGGKNSYGGVVTNYWYYTYDKDDKEYQLYVTLSDLDEESYSKYDDTDEMLEKLLKNAARETVSKIIKNSSMKLDKKSIKNINNMFSEDTLDNVELIDIDDSSSESDSDSK